MTQNGKTQKNLSQKIETLKSEIEKLKQRNKLLEDAEIKLKGLFLSMPDIVFAFDKEMRFTFVHTPAEEDLYLPPDMFLGKKFTEVMPQKFETEFTGAFAKVKQGKTADFEYCLKINGKERWFVAKLTPMLKNGLFSGAISIVRENTKEKFLKEKIAKANKDLQETNIQLATNQTQLKETNKKLKTAYQIIARDKIILHAIIESPHGMIIFALDKNYRYMTFTKLHKQVMKNIWGVDIKAGMNMLDIISNKEDRKKAKKNFDKALHGEYLTLIEEYGDEKLNRTFWENRYSPIYDENNNIIGVSVFVIDITERIAANEKLNALNQQLHAANQQLFAANQQLLATNQQLRATEQQLRAEEQQLRALNQQLNANEQELKKEKQFSENLLETANSIIVVLDTEAKILLFNKHAEQITGYKKEEVIGKNWFKTFTAPEQQIIYEVFLGVLQKMDEYSTYENSIICKDGSEKIINWRNTVLKTEHGEITGVLSVGTDVTKQRYIEEELRKNKIFFQSVFDGIQEPMHVIDKNFKIISTNKTLLDIIKKSQDEILGKHCYEVYQGLNERCKQCAAKNAFESKKVSVIRKTLTLEDGTQKHYEVYAFPLFKEEDGSVSQVIELTRDITESIQNEAEIRRLSAVIETTSQYVVITTLEGEVVYVNNAYLKMSKFTKEEIIGKSMFDFSTEEGISKLQNEVIPALITEGDWKGEMTVIDKDKNVFPADLVTTLLKNEKGEPEYFVAVFNDIRKRKRRELIQKVIYNITNAVLTTKNLNDFLSFIKEELGKILDTNNFYIVFYDKDSNTFSLSYHIDQKDSFKTFPSGKTLASYIIKTKKPLLATKDIKDKLVKEGKIEIIGHDSKVWLGAPLMLENEVKGVIAVQNYQDENAYSEEDLEVLEIIARQISIALERKKYEENLKNALEKAQESDRLKSAFLANMSHEIRTPMNSILGFTELLQNPKYSAEQKHEFINIIQINGKRMLDTINDIIDISKIETGQMTLSYKNTNVNEIIMDISKQLGWQAKQKGIELNYQMPLENSKAEICTDTTKLTSILTNLVKNAIKFTDKGGVLYGYELIDENSFLKFFVKDTGIGIPDERKQAIFNPFEQADIEDFDARQGSGLGLSIAKAYTEMLNGKLWFDSTVGKGSSFYFTIPFKPCKEEEEFVQTPPAKTPGDAYISKLKILIAEDNNTNLWLLSMFLADYKPEILIAENGKKAVEIAKNHPDLDLILMDMKMPVMDGYEATRKIREFNKDVVIVAQTAYALAGDDIKALEAGCNGYIAKPLNQNKLVDIINKLVNPS